MSNLILPFDKQLVDEFKTNAVSFLLKNRIFPTF